MIQTLLKDDTHIGKFVALNNFTEKKLISEGETAQEAYQKAIALGHKEPVITYIPSKDTIQIY